jgi:hypothetical protein
VDPEDSPPIFINIRLSRIPALLAVAMARKNQHKPRRQSTNFFFVIAPDDDIQAPMREYFNMGVSDVQMRDLLKAHYDTKLPTHMV